MSGRLARLSPILVLAACAAVAGAATGARTQVRVYRPFRSSGTPAVRVAKTGRGSCFSGSDAANRHDAWRCLNGHFVVDPCFSSGRAAGFVLCPIGASTEALRLTLSRALPRGLRDRRRPGSTRGLPWALITVRGWSCRLVTGATTVVDRRRLNYACQGTRNDLFGAPNRRHAPWRVFYAPPTARHLRHRIGIRTARF